MEINEQIKAIDKAMDKVHDALIQLENIAEHYAENENNKVPSSIKNFISSLNENVDELMSFRFAIKKLQEGNKQ